MWIPSGTKAEAAVASPTTRFINPDKPRPTFQLGSVDNPINLSPETKRREVGKSPGKIHKCSECDKTYTTSMGLYYHMQHPHRHVLLDKLKWKIRNVRDHLERHI